MKTIFTFLSIFLFSSAAYAQTTYQEVYSIFQTNCATAYCHNNASKAGALDLEGLGLSVSDKQTDVHTNIFKGTPGNSAAASKNNYTIYPGDPYRSFLFRKISNGFSDDNPLEPNEGNHMPAGGNLTDYEKEVIRQWIVYGANSGADGVDLSLVDEFYTNGGVESIPAAIEPPAEGEGFQIHLGPYFIEPGAEVEYMSKYEPLLDGTTEIIKFQTEMGTYSHHYIVYDFSNGASTGFDPNTVPYGLRENLGFDGKSFVLTEQYSNTLETPKGTAFKWDNNTVLDLNSHYINYSSTQVLKCEVYLNVYTQDNGTAAQVMRSQLIPNTNIPIPNDGQDITFNYPFSLPANINLYVWGVVSHTHQYGKDFNLYRRNLDGSQGAQVYDGGCADGLPGCAVEDFDYQHLPFRFFEPFLEVDAQEGIIAEATYNNDGPVPVNWGLTSNDEMMIFVIFFTLDTAGIDIYENPDTTSTGIRSPLNARAEVLFYPNPLSQTATFELSGINNGETVLQILDVSGKVCEQQIFDHLNKSKLQIDANNFSNGIYFYHFLQSDRILGNGKFIVNK